MGQETEILYEANCKEKENEKMFKEYCNYLKVFKRP